MIYHTVCYMHASCLLCTAASDEVDAKKKRTSDPMCKMNTYVDQSIKVRKLKHSSSDEVSRHFLNVARLIADVLCSKISKKLQAE